MAEEEKPNPKLDSYYLEKIKNGLVRPSFKGSAYDPYRKKKKKNRHRRDTPRIHRRYCAHCVVRVDSSDDICPVCSWPTVRADGLPDGMRPKRLKRHRTAQERAFSKEERKRRKQYRQYISQSPAWKALRKQVIQRDKGLCRRCSKPGNEVHHLTYRRLFHESLDDLELLCKDCHDRAHPWKK